MVLSDADINLLATAQAFELSFRDIYANVVSRAKQTGEELALIKLMHEHHVAYEQTLNGVLSKRAANSRNDEVFTKYFAALSDSSKTWQTLLDLENFAVATHTTILETLASAKHAEVIASIITVEARHAAMIASIISPDITANLGLALDLPSQQTVTP